MAAAIEIWHLWMQLLEIFNGAPAPVEQLERVQSISEVRVRGIGKGEHHWSEGMWKWVLSSTLQVGDVYNDICEIVSSIQRMQHSIAHELVAQSECLDAMAQEAANSVCRIKVLALQSACWSKCCCCCYYCVLSTRNACCGLLWVVGWVVQELEARIKSECAWASPIIQNLSTIIGYCNGVIDMCMRDYEPLPCPRLFLCIKASSCVKILIMFAFSRNFLF